MTDEASRPRADTSGTPKAPEIVQQRGLLTRWCEQGRTDWRVLIVEAPGGAGLSTFLGEVTRSPAVVIDDAQRHPTALGRALDQLTAEPSTRLLLGIDVDDDHAGAYDVETAIDQRGLSARLTTLGPWEPGRLTAIVTAGAPDTSPLVIARLVARAQSRPKLLARLSAQPTVRRRIVRDAIRMHPEEVDHLPLSVDLLLEGWNELEEPARTTTVVVWLLGGQARPAEVRRWGEVAPADGEWVTQDGDWLWLGKRVSSFIAALDARGAPIIDAVRARLPQARAQRSPAAMVLPDRPPRTTPAPLLPTPEPTPAPPPPNEVTVTSLRADAARIALARGADSGAAFMARRRLADKLVKTGDLRAAVDEYRTLAVDLQNARGQNDPFACEMLFELGRLLALSNHSNGEPIARTAIARIEGLERASQADGMRRRLEQAMLSRRQRS